MRWAWSGLVWAKDNVGHETGSVSRNCTVNDGAEKRTAIHRQPDIAK